MQKPNSIRKLLGLHFYLDIPTFILCISFRYLFLTHTKHQSTRTEQKSNNNKTTTQTMSAVNNNNNNNNDYNNDEKLTVIMTWCYYQKIIFPVTTTISYVVGVIIYIFKNLFTVIWKNTYSWAESRPEKNQRCWINITWYIRINGSSNVISSRWYELNEVDSHKNILKKEETLSKTNKISTTVRRILKFHKEYDHKE